jgi:branched chain amino acid efflux pump
MMLVIAVFALGLGTFAFRVAGPVLRARVELSPRVEKLMMTGVAVLFAALVATATLI